MFVCKIYNSSCIQPLVQSDSEDDCVDEEEEEEEEEEEAKEEEAKVGEDNGLDGEADLEVTTTPFSFHKKHIEETYLQFNEIVMIN